MRMVILFIALSVLLSGCSFSKDYLPNDSVPLPPNKKLSETACPSTERGESCYLIPLKHHEVVKWYGVQENTKGWSVSDGSDVAPFHLFLSSNDNLKKVLVVIYEQKEDIETGLLVSNIEFSQVNESFN